MLLLVGAAAWKLLAPGAERLRTGTSAAHGVTVERYEVASKAVSGQRPQVALLPPGKASGRPLLVFLHGRGSAEESTANSAFAKELADLGDRAPVVVFPNGGDHSYWHNRKDGDWGSYVLDEVIPEAVKRFDLDGRRVAIGGISMGGFGAFSLARDSDRSFCAVGGHSAALWQQAGDTPDGAFDDADDFSKHDVIAAARAQGAAPWKGAQLWLDGGDEDPFRESGEAFASALGIPMRHWSGAHEGKYWTAHYRDYLRFYARALSECRT